ncbi:hypothetical protein SAMN02949497_3324 [Methylomagnum ishizawai]|uniref:Uncharacterized protein n=1 Tax=Methylomagnum ishizawai TaxID=1760988 RepID=A0A1Y6D048_9GAMM|nr:hypothetical protein [Methylomagnum ishizawai]SMF95946.1 hypothetical protein SAMN02949497_3324 [Methylomagnum ishizawai]
MARTTSYEEASREAAILRDAIVAIENAERLPVLQRGERSQLYNAKTALEYALLRIAIDLLEQRIGTAEASE